MHPLKTEMELKWPAVNKENGSFSGGNNNVGGGRSHKLLFLSILKSSVKETVQAELVLNCPESRVRHVRL